MNRVGKTAAVLFLGTGISLFAADANVVIDVNTQENMAAATAQNERSGDAGVSPYGVSGGGTGTGQMDIDTQIEKIKHADPEKRRELMNQFKRELTQMNHEQRTEALSKLHGGYAQKGTAHAKAHVNRRTNTDGQCGNMRHMAQIHQKTQMKEMGNAERMGQKRGVDQYMHNHPNMAAGGAAHGHAVGGGTAHNPHNAATPFKRH